MDEKRSPFEKVNIENISLEEKEKLSDPNYKVTGKMEGKTEQPKTFGSKSQTKDSEDKIYIIFIVPEIGEFESNFAPTPNVLVDGEFVICRGRTDAYTSIVELLESQLEELSIDILESKVLVEGLSCTQSVSIYKFMKYCEGIYENQDFNIEEYLNEDESPNSINPNTEVLTSGNGFSAASILLDKIKEENENGK